MDRDEAPDGDDLRAYLEEAYDAAFGPEPDVPMPDGDSGVAEPEPEPAAEAQPEAEKSLAAEVEAAYDQAFKTPQQADADLALQRRKEIDELLGADALRLIRDTGKGRHHAVRLALQAHRRLIDEPLAAAPELVAKIAGALSPSEKAYLRAALLEATGTEDAGSSDPAMRKLAIQGAIARIQADAYRHEEQRIEARVAQDVEAFKVDKPDFEGLKPVMMDVMRQAVAAGQEMTLEQVYKTAKAYQQVTAPAAAPPQPKPARKGKAEPTLRGDDLTAALDAAAAQIGLN